MTGPRTDSPPILQRLAALGDLARVRTLRLLERSELSVGELARALQLPQSTVSRHLKALSADGWIIKRSEGPASLYRLQPESLDDHAARLWTIIDEGVAGAPSLQEDDRRLERVLEERRENGRSFFGRLGGAWDSIRGDLFGARFTAEALLALLPRDWVIADLGCGTGQAAELVAPWVRRLILIDRESAMLDAARRRLRDCAHVEFRIGDLLAPPLAAQEIDAALLVLVLHHVDDPTAAIGAIAKALRPGGAILIVDMAPHDRESYRGTMGHRHLGFAEPTVRAWAEAAGLHLEPIRAVPPDTDAKGPGLFVAVLRRPGSAAGAPRTADARGRTGSARPAAPSRRRR